MMAITLKTFNLWNINLIVKHFMETNHALMIESQGKGIKMITLKVLFVLFFPPLIPVFSLMISFLFKIFNDLIPPLFTNIPTQKLMVKPFV